jgi:hypothetical protein
MYQAAPDGAPAAGAAGGDASGAATNDRGSDEDVVDAEFTEA